ncbi:MAG: DUF4399 domain-containing protein [Rhodospirillales bacterium]|nr:DUF4399 domain-containing protein [Rhodospirillales bacterium]
MERYLLLIMFGFCAVAGVAHADSAGASTKLYIVSPSDGAVVSSPLTIRFGLKGMGVAPAGIDAPKTGHHHLVIDAPLPALDETIPKDEHYRHFGGGQTETMIELAPGSHTLQLVLGDHAHVPHNPPLVSEQVSVTVK